MGQERLKLALILNAINPLIGGVLIGGENGTAKSTAARGLAELFPPIPLYGRPWALSPLPQLPRALRAGQGPQAPGQVSFLSFVGRVLRAILGA